MARTQRSLREGWPQAKIGFTAYFREFEQAEFPVTLAVAGEKKTTTVVLDATGVVAMTAEQKVVWQSDWEGLTFSNGPDLILHDGKQAIRLESGGSGRSPLEELVIKYGRLTQMHF
ncbi:hypothetical protein ACEXQB_000960 [Herbiconiux sp. P18]|uniref:hypothetical protein n=1 Tax=Herbiconiux liangxiaofengii TaxID=3342795 RepID=UPI0035B8EE78